ncbi:MAG: hypothetical protein KHZ62_00745 [Clostridiales bacterium]|nr:hypothetical protein [Clostridiales bacterium]
MKWSLSGAGEVKKETEHIVAFLDLLGASEVIQGGKSEIILNKIYDVYQLSIEHWSKDQIFNSFGELKISVFSDNILIARELEPIENKTLTCHRISQILNFLSFIGMFQAIALEHQLMFRGGISIGKLYINSLMVWGSALVSAHWLEEKVAIYPRVVFSDETVNQILFLKPCLLKQDFDGIYYVDFLVSLISQRETLIQKIDQIIKKNRKELKRNTKSQNINQKYDWLESYIQMYREPKSNRIDCFEGILTRIQ